MSDSGQGGQGGRAGPLHAVVRFLTPDEEAARQLAATAIARKFERSTRGTMPVRQLSLEPLRQTIKSQVYAVAFDTQVECVLKMHKHRVNFIDEAFAYELLKGPGVGTVIKRYDRSKAFVFAFETARAAPFGAEALNRFVVTLARLHASACARIREFGLVDLCHIQFQKEREGLQGSQHGCDFLEAYVSARAQPEVSMRVGDLKPEHIFEVHGDFRIVDLETAKIGAPEHFDLLSLPFLVEKGRWTLRQVKNCVDLYARTRQEYGEKCGEKYVSSGALWNELSLYSRALFGVKIDEAWQVARV
ncbi:MAG: hypothetical protein IOD12_18020 [Silvanigrellales bacterium]|nr:hypothetical protein [Silvanigrellales bacterium]